MKSAWSIRFFAHVKQSNPWCSVTVLSYPCAKNSVFSVSFLRPYFALSGFSGFLM